MPSELTSADDSQVPAVQSRRDVLDLAIFVRGNVYARGLVRQ